MKLKLGKYGVWAKKYLEEYKPFKFSRLVIDGSVMDYLLEFEYHLNGYANLIEFELREKFPAPSENESFFEQVNYIYMIQEMVDEFVQFQLDKLYDDFIMYLDYWNENYYRNGFVDGSQIAMRCFEE